jgi:hypothetical protein
VAAGRRLADKGDGLDVAIRESYPHIRNCWIGLPLILWTMAGTSNEW